MRSVVAVVILVSCAPAHREVTPPREVVIDAAPPIEPAVLDVDAAPIADAVPAVDAAPSAPDAGAVASGGCPASFKSGGGACSPAAKKCNYPEGTCTCAAESYCGGAPPPPEVLQQLAQPRWICEHSPKVLGPDGCPLGDPSGLACTKPGKTCHYTPCCSLSVSCLGGKWVPGQMMCPP